MGPSEWTAVAIALMVAIFGLVGWSLNRQIAQAEKEREDERKHYDDQIKLLFRKHDEDANKLQDLRELVIGQHYRRDELDTRFERLETTFKNGFEDMGEKLDGLSKAMVSHIGEHTGVLRSGAPR